VGALAAEMIFAVLGLPALDVSPEAPITKGFCTVLVQMDLLIAEVIGLRTRKDISRLRCACQINTNSCNLHSVSACRRSKVSRRAWPERTQLSAS
jgi:hypothetical protein